MMVKVSRIQIWCQNLLLNLPGWRNKGVTQSSTYTPYRCAMHQIKKNQKKTPMYSVVHYLSNKSTTNTYAWFTFSSRAFLKSFSELWLRWGRHKCWHSHYWVRHKCWHSHYCARAMRQSWQEKVARQLRSYQVNKKFSRHKKILAKRREKMKLSSIYTSCVNVYSKCKSFKTVKKLTISPRIK